MSSSTNNNVCFNISMDAKQVQNSVNNVLGQIATIPQFSSVNGNVSLQVCMNAKDVVSTLQNMNLVPNNN